MKRLVRIGVLATCLFASHVAFAAATRATSSVSATAALFNRSAWADSNLGDINPGVFALALEAATSAVERGAAADPGTLTVIDYSRPSTEKRMWVYDLRSHALLFDELVSHGRGSGKTNATSFSNDSSSNMSSLGLFRTGEAYIGHNGYSLRLDGLDPGVNDNARARAIVVHGAPYVNAAIAKANGYLGRSLGCPAVRPEIAHALIDTIKNGSLIFAYGTDGPSGRGSAEFGIPR
jgi:hypothetical protein